MTGKATGIVALAACIGLMLTLRGGSAEILGALFVGIVIGRLLPVLFQGA